MTGAAAAATIAAVAGAAAGDGAGAEGVARDIGAAATAGLLAWWLERFDEVSVDEMTEIIDRLVIRPVTIG